MTRVGYLWFGFLVLVGGLGMVVAALVLVELGWWVDWVAFEGLAAAASCGYSNVGGRYAWVNGGWNERRLCVLYLLSLWSLRPCSMPN